MQRTAKKLKLWTQKATTAQKRPKTMLMALTLGRGLPKMASFPSTTMQKMVCLMLSSRKRRPCKGKRISKLRMLGQGVLVVWWEVQSQRTTKVWKTSKETLGRVLKLIQRCTGKRAGWAR
jgi:hypothetical protein